jgi:hypothetical protein
MKRGLAEVDLDDAALGLDAGRLDLRQVRLMSLDGRAEGVDFRRIILRRNS